MVELLDELVERLILVLGNVVIGKLVLSLVIIDGLLKFSICKSTVINKGLSEKKVVSRLLGEELFNILLSNVTELDSQVTESLVNALLSDVYVLNLFGRQKPCSYRKHTEPQPRILLSLERLRQILGRTQLVVE